MTIIEGNSWNLVVDKFSLLNEIKKNPEELISCLARDCNKGILSSSWLEANKIVKLQHKYSIIYKLFSEILDLKNNEEMKIPTKKLFKNLSVLFKNLESISELNILEKNKEIILDSLKIKNDFFSKDFLKLIPGTDLQDSEILFEAILSNCPKTLNFILKRITPDEKTITDAIFLICSNIETDAETIKKLISNYKEFDLSCKNVKSQTPLYVAYEESNVNAFKVLLELGASLTEKNSCKESVLDLMHSCFQNSKFNSQFIEVIKKEEKSNIEYTEYLTRNSIQ